MRVDLPPPPPGPMREYLVILTQALHRSISRAIDETTAVEAFHLRATDGKVYRVTVSTTGVLTATHVQGGP